MNDHHFSYPRVVPLVGMTISGHSSEPPETVGTLQPAPPPPATVRRAGALTGRSLATARPARARGRLRAGAWAS
jgi:hypothetical protein